VLKAARSISSFIFIFFSSGAACQQNLNYQVVFGNDWEKALTFVEKNKSFIEPRLKQFHINYAEAIAIIFPELVRYSALSDKIEITLLKALYSNLGEEYANFSIGHFQMKPSFAEMVREKAFISMGKKAGLLFKKKSDYDNIKKFRSSIVSDLENTETEINYLIAFIKICEDSFDLKSMNVTERVRFMATAYNYGFSKTSEQIENMIGKKYFNTSLLKSSTYSYCDVSLFWYKRYTTGKKEGKEF
jgi:hypothetical protein